MTPVHPRHLRRRAYVYIRQSTLGQVERNIESLQRQYELTERAASLGWRPAEVVVIDEDLGRSGASAEGRSGFQRLVAEVGLGKVGIVIGIEVSRLARRNADWYQLLDLCALTDTLIADADGIYHPGMHNDRLVLGLKGTMSEAELHVIRSRLQGGLLHKAAKGELRWALPVGYDHDEDGRVCLSADEQVRDAIADVFARFERLGSGRQVMLGLVEEGRKLPRRRAGERKVRWVRASYPPIHDFLTNPFYSGAYVFGRTRVEHRVEDGRVRRVVRETARDEWIVCIPEHHAGFISFEQYEANRARLRSNFRPPRGQAGGAVREGPALLQGRVRCGRCGRRMQVAYSGSKGDCPRYACVRAHLLHGAEESCQSMGGRRLERNVVDAVLEALRPAGIEATLRAIEEATADHEAGVRAAELEVERARYEAERSERQYDACEPENRLVARTLEREWERRLVELREAERALAARQLRRPEPLSPEEIAWCRRAGADLKRVFDAPTTTDRDRKELLRAIIAEVVLTVDRELHVARIRIVWEGGAATDLQMPLARRGQDRGGTTDPETVELVRMLAVHYTDAQIAQILYRRGRRTGAGNAFTRSRVNSLRNRHGILPGPVVPPCQDGQAVTVHQAAKELGVSPDTIYRWLRGGFIRGEQLTPGAPWQIRLTDGLRAKVAEEEPAGWLPLDGAAKALGVARQTVLHWVHSGKLAAVYVRRGKRKGLRIQANRVEAGLFDERDGKEGQC